MTDRIEVDSQRVEDLVLELVSYYSPSGREEEVCEFVADRLMAEGIPVQYQPVSEGRSNLLVRPLRGPADLLLMGHLDTVTASTPNQWEPEVVDGQLVGLGSADMKGGCAALIEAFIAAWKQTGGAPGAILALVVGEEETGDGTAALLEHECPPLAIVAEPTDMAICTAHFGYLEVLVETLGVKRHAAEASHDRNAVFSMLRALVRLTDHLAKEHPDIICNIRDLQSSTAGFAVPDRCTVWVDLHVPPRMKPSDLAGEVGALLDACDRDLPGTFRSPEFVICHEGYSLDDGDPLQDALREAMAESGRPWSPGVFRSHSDANLLAQAGCRAIVLGPGQLSRAHTVDEQVPLAQVTEAARLYHAVLERFARQPQSR